MWGSALALAVPHWARRQPGHSLLLLRLHCCQCLLSQVIPELHTVHGLLPLRPLVGGECQVGYHSSKVRRQQVAYTQWWQAGHVSKRRGLHAGRRFAVLDVQQEHLEGAGAKKVQN